MSNKKKKLKSVNKKKKTTKKAKKQVEIKKQPVIKEEKKQNEEKNIQQDIKEKNTKKKFNDFKNKMDVIKNRYIDKIKSIYKKKKNKKTTKKDNVKEKIELDYNSLSIDEIETELKKEKYKSKYFNILSSTVYGLIIVAALAAIIATLIMPVFQISGSSMKPVLNNGDLVISIKTKKLNSGDIIAFYHGNKILVKRVIARAGQWVVIDESGKVYVDGVLLEEPYIESFVLGDCDIKFPYQVPAESWFVLGDNRTIFTDSRNSEIGSIKEEDIIGKILFKLWDTNK